MRLELHNNVCFVSGSKAEIAWLHGTPERQGYLVFKFTKGTGANVSTERRTVLRQAEDGRHYFPAGLAQRVKRAAEQPDTGKPAFEVVFVDKREPPCDPDFDADLGWLMPHQREAIDLVAKHTRGIIQHATSGGKGDTVVGLAKFIPCRWLFGAYSFHLVADEAKRWAKDGDGSRPGVVGDGNFDLGDERFVCATWQTLAARVKRGCEKTIRYLASVQGVVVEEAHTGACSTVMELAAYMPNAYWWVGVSGTPLDRTDKMSVLVVCLIGDIIHKVSAQQLVEMGWSAEAQVKILRVEQNSVVGDWKRKHRHLIIESIVRNEAVVRLVQMAERPSMVFFQEIAHGKHLAKMCAKAGVRCDLSYGTDRTEMRRNKLRWLVREGDAVLFVNKTFQEGEVDKSIADVRSIINVAGGRSKIRVIQQLGRGMRKRRADGSIAKETFDVYDIEDVLTDIDQSNPPSLVVHSRERIKAYKRAGHKITYIE